MLDGFFSLVAKGADGRVFLVQFSFAKLNFPNFLPKFIEKKHHLIYFGVLHVNIYIFFLKTWSKVENFDLKQS